MKKLSRPGTAREVWRILPETGEEFTGRVRGPVWRSEVKRNETVHYG